MHCFFQGAHRRWLASLCLTSAGWLLAAAAQAQGPAVATADAVYAQAQAEVQPLLDSLQALVTIESGSHDLEGLDRAAAWIAAQLQQTGMQVQTLTAHAPAKPGQAQGERVGSMVLGRLQGQGAKKVLLIAHMDTVYPKGMGARQPFRIEGGKAYGLAIADDKSGVALILHTVKLLQAMDFRDYAELAVLINAQCPVASQIGPQLFHVGTIVPVIQQEHRLTLLDRLAFFDQDLAHQVGDLAANVDHTQGHNAAIELHLDGCFLNLRLNNCDSDIRVAGFFVLVVAR